MFLEQTRHPHLGKSIDVARQPVQLRCSQLGWLPATWLSCASLHKAQLCCHAASVRATSTSRDGCLLQHTVTTWTISTYQFISRYTDKRAPPFEYTAYAYRQTLTGLQGLLNRQQASGLCFSQPDGRRKLPMKVKSSSAGSLQMAFLCTMYAPASVTGLRMSRRLFSTVLMCSERVVLIAPNMEAPSAGAADLTCWDVKSLSIKKLVFCTFHVESTLDLVSSLALDFVTSPLLLSRYGMPSEPQPSARFNTVPWYVREEQSLSSFSSSFGIPS